MLKIEKVTTEDFERVYPQLQKFNSAEVSKEDWRKLFVKYWESPEDFCGYMLVKDGEVKGFLGLIFSRRILDGEVHKFCNMTSWIVDADARSHSIFLLLETLKLKGYTFTNFSASDTVGAVLSKLGFKGFEVNQWVLPPLPNLFLQGRGYTCQLDLGKIRLELNENDRIIFDDHKNLGCEHVLLKERAGGYAYVILRKTQRRNIPLAKVQYVSNGEHFAKAFEKFIVKICLRIKALGVMGDDRYLGNYKLRKSIRYPHPRKAYFKPNPETLDVNRIDTLYSELVVLYNPKAAQ